MCRLGHHKRFGGCEHLGVTSSIIYTEIQKDAAYLSYKVTFLLHNGINQPGVIGLNW